jgi:site-specific DNA-methyltransferase (adenine-specific)
MGEIIMADYYSKTLTTRNDWATPKNFFDLLDHRFHFTLDPCASDTNHKCNKYYTVKDNGLAISWQGETAFVNPPFSESTKWIEKSWRESTKPKTEVIMIIPARTDTIYWHKYIMPFAYQIWFCKGRVNFELDGQKPKNGSTFPLAVVIFNEAKRLSLPMFKSWDWKAELKVK